MIGMGTEIRVCTDESVEHHDGPNSSPSRQSLHPVIMSLTSGDEDRNAGKARKLESGDSEIKYTEISSGILHHGVQGSKCPESGQARANA